MAKAEKILSELKKYNFVIPNYKDSNLSVIREMVEQSGNRTGNKKKKIFMLVDGLGYNLIESLLMGDKKVLHGAKIDRISTVFPSTTTTALSSMETGLTPAEHGIVGWHVYSRGAWGICNAFQGCAIDGFRAQAQQRGDRQHTPGIFPAHQGCR